MTIISTLKKRYASIVGDRVTTERGSIVRSWKIILVGFGVIEVIFLALVLFSSYRLEERQTADILPTEAFGEESLTIDRERLQGLFDQFERKAATHEALRLAAPTHVDPSVRSWYRESDL